MWIALLPLIKPTTCDNRVFRRDRDQDVHVIWLQMAFLNPTFPLRG
jgi:hypothetical protein